MTTEDALVQEVERERRLFLRWKGRPHSAQHQYHRGAAIAFTRALQIVRGDASYHETSRYLDERLRA